ncbi:MAG: hypothetical protein P8X98_09090 [Woeseiaceae bacterium]
MPAPTAAHSARGWLSSAAVHAIAAAIERIIAGEPVETAVAGFARARPGSLATWRVTGGASRHGGLLVRPATKTVQSDHRVLAGQLGYRWGSTKSLC